MTELIAPTTLVAEITRLWTDRRLDDTTIQEPGAQDDFRQHCDQELGEEWDRLRESVRANLSRHPFSTIVRGQGCPVPHALLAALAAGVGEMMNPYRELVPDSPVLQEIVPKGPSSPDQVWLWHTDSANWVSPNDFSGLACQRAAPSGGATQTLSLATIRRSEDFDEAVMAPLWQSKIKWPIDGFLGGGSFIDHSIRPDTLRFRRELMLGRDSREYDKAVQAFSDLADSCDPDVSALLRPGDVLLFDNTRVMHRAGPVDDPERVRLLTRTKIRRGTW